MILHLRKETILPIYLLLFIALLPPAMCYGDSISKKAQEGVAHYQQQKYREAAQSFQEAIEKQPDNSNLAYNLANSKYKSGKFEESLGSYAKSMSDSNLKHQSLYNTGNALYRMGKLEEAASAYKKALELNPNDMDSKFNLEFTREQINKKNNKSDQSKQNQDKQNQKSNNSDQNQQPNDPGQDHDSRGQGKEDQPNNDQEQPGTGKRETKPLGDKINPSQSAKSGHAEMNKDEAEQWLRSLEENPKKFAQRQIQDKFKKEIKPVGNDW